MEKTKIWKKCPRCGEKNYVANKKCENCGLVFSRLEFTSSAKAQEAILKGEKEKILKTSDFPRDLSRLKAILLCVFGGLLGLHNIYVKRYIKGFFCMFFTLLTAILILVLDSSVQTQLYEVYLWIPGSMVFIFWFYDLAMLLLKKYKVPVALDMPTYEKKEGEEDGK